MKIAANASFARASGGVERTASNSDGSFELFNYSVKPRTLGNDVSKGVVYFFHPDYIDHQIEDIYALAPKQREALRIVLETGYKVTGTVFDVAGKPVPNAMIKAIRKDGTHRKATMTDANGKFALRGLSKGLTSLSARALDIKQKIHLPMAVNGDQERPRSPTANHTIARRPEDVRRARHAARGRDSGIEIRLRPFP